MILIRQIKVDIRQGILLKWPFYLITFAISLGLTALFVVSKNNLIVQGKISGSVSLGDAFYYMFRGMREYDPLLKKAFDIVDSFLIWNLLLAFMAGNYPVSDLKTTGKNYLVRANTRRQWWLSKCAWNVFTVLAFYMCIFAGMLIGTYLCSLFTDNITWTSVIFNPELFKKIFLVDLQGGTQGYILAQMIVLPVAASLAISMFQMAVSLIANAPIGYITVVTICVFSAYYMKWFLIGNGMMVYRYRDVNPNGIGILLPLLASLIIFVLSGLVGYISFRNKDIL